MIYDCFPFFNELELLDIRLEELYPVVDKFVIVESSITFRGHEKPWYLANNTERYEKYIDKMFIYSYTDNYDHKNDQNISWSREKYQRSKIDIALKMIEPEPEDVILVSDCDEIPRRDAVAGLDKDASFTEYIDLSLPVFVYGINLRAPYDHTMKAIRYKDYTTAQDVRMATPQRIVFNSGWEFSSMGTPQHISHKLKNFAHHELDTDFYTSPILIQHRIDNRDDILGEGTKYLEVAVDDTWPEAVKNNRDYWKRYEW